MTWFGGKGGVGNDLRGCHCPGGGGCRAGPQILLLSADPAHSLSDVLKTTFSNEPRKFPDGPGNLEVRELDAVLALRRAREEYALAIDGLFDRASAPASTRHTIAASCTGLIDLAPPGLDELVAILEVTTLMVGDGFRDLASHRARHSSHRTCASSPRDAVLILDWTRALMRIVLKYQPVVGVGSLGEYC